MLLQYLFVLFLAFSLLRLIVFKIIEPAYLYWFNKPLYIYFYPLPQKISILQKEILVKEFPFYDRLSEKKKVYFEHRVYRFIKSYKFIGKEGMFITDQMKVLIAATYVMLTFGMRNYIIKLFRTIIIFPSTYFSNSTQQYHKGEFNPKMKVVAFSWADFLNGHIANTDNLNLGLHEFAHVLHINSLRSYHPSAVKFRNNFSKVILYFTDQKLNKQLDENDYFRDYAFVNQFEFLAVILEHFFETPAIFKEKYPELFQHVATMINFNEKILEQA